MATRKKKSPLKGKKHKKWGKVSPHRRRVAGVEHTVCVTVPSGYDLRLVKAAGKVGKRKKKAARKRK